MVRTLGYQLFGRPACNAAHIRAGVAGMSMCSTPSERSASTTAFITAGGAPIAPDSPTPLMPSGLVLHGTLLNCVVSVAHVVGARHRVVHVAAGQQLAAVAVVDHVLHQRLADALRDAALDLAFADHRVDGAPAVVDDGVAVDRRLRRSPDRARPRTTWQPLG